MAQNRHWEQDKDATVYIGNIDERANPSTIYEVMLQMGPIHNIHMPRDRVTQTHQGFGFVEFRTPQDAEYAANVMNGVKLYGKSLRVNKASADKQKQAEVGAELFVGNLDAMVDEKILYDTFSRFGQLLSLPKVAREDSGASKGFGFISYGDFESSDTAVEMMHGQYILSKEVSVQYAFKKDGKGDRHGDDAERELAAQAKKRNIVPESQPVPAAFLMNGPPAPAPMAPPPSAFDPAAAGGMPMPAMPVGVPAGFAQAPRGAPPTYNAVPPPAMGGIGRGNATVLPPPPSGLPARPPQGQGGYNNPADFHPHPAAGFRGAPPPGAPQAFPAVPPPGFPTPPPGATGGPPAPAGFMPPGFAPPPGFPRR